MSSLGAAALRSPVSYAPLPTSFAWLLLLLYTPLCGVLCSEWLALAGAWMDRSSSRPWSNQLVKACMPRE